MAGLYEKRKKRKVFGPLSAFIILICLCWAGGFLFFMQLVPKNLPVTNEKTDGIVVLTGGTQRLNTALSLLEAKRANKLLISGVYRGVDLNQLLRHFRQAPAELECCIDIGHEADDTRGNAAETQDWVEKNNYTSILLVTANYHMPRSLLEIHHRLPDTTIITHPVFPDAVKVNEWWRWPGTASLLVGEYNKFLLVWIRHRLARFSAFESLK